MDILTKIRSGFTFFDGGMGTLLQEKGLKAGELPEEWNLTHPDEISDIHLSYIEAGADIINSNTFGANSLKFSKDRLKSVIKASFEAASSAKKNSGREDVYIALDIGPLGKLLKPYGELDFEDAVSVFAETVKAGASLGFDLINIETMTDSYETKAAVLAAKENSDLPVFASNVYNKNGLTMTGTDIPAMTALLEGLGVAALGLNCSLGPKDMKPLVPVFYKYASVPVIICPNAGLPGTVAGKTVYDMTPYEFSAEMAEIAESGATVLGGCCGTSPLFIKEVVKKVKGVEPKKIEEKPITLVSSRSKAVEIGEDPVIIGERINPTGKKKLKEALKNFNIDYILNEGISQSEAGCHILDVNAGLPEIDEVKVLTEIVEELSAVCDLPLQIDSSNFDALESAVRRYDGKAVINSVNGKKSVMERVFPLVKKYGGVVIGLTLDDEGIPETAEGRYKIAEKIYNEAEKYGISKKNVIIDPLTMTVSAGKDNANITLDALKMIKASGGKTVLGVSNVSFGLPSRDVINSAFFTLALNEGLSAAIINPLSKDMMDAYFSFRALKGLDGNFKHYIERFSASAESSGNKESAVPPEKENPEDALSDAVKKGLLGKAEKETYELLKSKEPEDIINNVLIPALDKVGEDFESNKIFLPQLLLSADAAGRAFDIIKMKMAAEGSDAPKKGTIALATVKGDIHDIGKNIVKAILENYGYNVIDLGKDVPPETIVSCVKENNLKLAGLSALMTSTVPAMEETIKLLRKEAPGCKIVVGGAVLTYDYARKIGADKYAKDAMETVRYAEEVFKETT